MHSSIDSILYKLTIEYIGILRCKMVVLASLLSSSYSGLLFVFTLSLLHCDTLYEILETVLITVVIAN